MLNATRVECKIYCMFGNLLMLSKLGCMYYVGEGDSKCCRFFFVLVEIVFTIIC